MPKEGEILESIEINEFVYDIDYVTASSILELKKEVRKLLAKESYEYEPSGPPAYGAIDNQDDETPIMGWVQLMVQMDEEEIPAEEEEETEKKE